MKKWIFLCSIFLLLVGCTGSEDLPATNENPPATDSPSNEPQAVAPDSLSSEPPLPATEAEETEAVYIDESQYEGDALIFAQLINRAVQYINEENEDGYKSLLASNSPINSLPKRKVNKVELVEIGEPYGSNIVVDVNDWRDGEEQSRTYVFTKENNEWKILDID
jgi:hypothetical protein